MQILPRVASLCLVLFVVLAGAPRQLAAQDRPELPDRSGSTEISQRVVANLSFSDLAIAPDALARVFPMPGGGWGVSSGVFDGVVAHFRPDGTAARSFGREGEGPGEFGGQVFGVPVGDQLWTIDPANARLSAFTEEVSLVADRRLPGRVFSASPSRDGASILITGFLRHDGTTVGVARLSMDETRDVFGGEIEDAPSPRAQIHMAAEAANGEVWTAAVSGGAVNVLKSSDLSVLKRFRLPDDVAWRVVEGRRDRSKPPPPQVAGVTADSAGRLWVVVGVPDRDWSPDLDLDEGIRQAFDTYIFVINPDRRAVMAQARLDPLCFPVEGSRVSCVDELEEVVEVVALGLTRNSDD